MVIAATIHTRYKGEENKVNKIEELFNTDERIIIRHKKREKIFTFAYSIFDIRQWPYIVKWWKSNRPGITPYGDEAPWITYRATNFLSKNLPNNAKIFEYGSGGSTLYYSKKAENLISVEHDKSWYKILQAELKKRKVENCLYLSRPSKKSKDSLHEYFNSWREQEVSFKDYVEAIAGYKDDSFDLVSVDGRSRVACVKEAYNKVRSGGLILLDNSDRKDYFSAHLFLRDKGCSPHHFFGLVGYETLLSQTTIWVVNK